MADRNISPEGQKFKKGRGSVEAFLKFLIPRARYFYPPWTDEWWIFFLPPNIHFRGEKDLDLSSPIVTLHFCVNFQLFLGSLYVLNYQHHHKDRNFEVHTQNVPKNESLLASRT